MVCITDTPHDPTENPKTYLLSNLRKIYSEQIVLKALEKSSRQPSKVPTSPYPTPQLPSWFAWGKGTGTCSPPATFPALQAPRGVRTSQVQPLHPVLSEMLAQGEQPPARLQPKETTLRTARVMRYPKRDGSLQILSLIRASQLPTATAQAMPHSLLWKSVSGRREAEPGHTPMAETEKQSSCVSTAALTTRARAIYTKTACVVPLHH